MRAALDLSQEVPLLLCDARERDSTKQVLTILMEHVMDRNDLAAAHPGH